MAVLHKFKEGIDWIASVDGDIPLSNYKFCDGLTGSDATADGSDPETPYATPNAMHLALGTSETGVILEGEYVCSTIVMTNMIGDGVVTLNGQNAASLTGPSASYRSINIIFKDFSQSAIVSRFRSGASSCTFINCSIPAYSSFNSLEGPTYIGCTMINSTSKISGGLKNNGIRGCKLFNTDWETAGKDNYSNYIDSSSTVIVNSESWTYNNNQGTVVIVPGASSSNNMSVDPGFNNLTGQDYTLRSDSPHIFSGFDKETIGYGVVATSLYQSVPLLDNAIEGNANISYNSFGEIVNNSVADQNLDLDTITLQEINYLGVVIRAGFPEASKIKLFISWALADSVFGSFQEFRFDLTPTLDDSGKSNGESGYTWAQVNEIPAKYYKIRIKVLAP